MNSSFSASRLDRQFEEVLRDGVTAAKSGQRSLAARLLTRATLLNPMDARPYLWLSATTDDPKEQREYLEQAVARDPTNVAARRGLALLTGKIDQSRLMPEGAGMLAREGNEDVEAHAQTFLCPKCGGHMSFSVTLGLLSCEYCGYVNIEEPEGQSARKAAPVADQAEQVLDFVMPTTRGHRWAEAQHSLSCERCGALSLLPPGQTASQCPYCGSNQMIESAELGELVDPQVIIPMQIDEQQALKQVKDWLGRGIFSPDNLLSATQGLRLRPAYYSAWTFDGTLEVSWSCEVRQGSGQYQHWESISGVETQFFNDVLVPGVRALTWKELESIEPYDLVNVEEFKPEFLAGWPAIIYDRSLADASLLGREHVLKRIRPQFHSTVAVGYEKRDLRIGAGKWSGMTFKHVLLPLWIGTYHYRGQEYHLLVNGQTGKVGGFKPRDSVKLVFLILITLGVAALLALLYWVLTSGGLAL
ncbi:MAG: hypothetical protein JXB15_11815 [Anaerolineales bacterium]|nr:hypothetical protein [Anaerolineales bacterium]